MPTPSKRGSPRWTRSPPFTELGPAGGSGPFKDTDVANITGPPDDRRLADPSRDGRGGPTGTVRRDAVRHEGGPWGPRREARPRKGRGPFPARRSSARPTPTSFGGPSARPDAVRHRLDLPGEAPGSEPVATDRPPPRGDRPGRWCSVRASPLGERDTELARPVFAAVIAPSRGPSRGKGVRAA